MLTNTLVKEVKHFETHKGGEIFQIPLLVFPHLWGYAYLVLTEDIEENPYRVLIDTGSGFGDSNMYLESGFESISKRLGYSINLADLTHVLITHGHIDHIGGLTYVRPRTKALIGVHELDLRILTNFEERLIVVARRLEEYFLEAGVPPDQCDHLIKLYMIPKAMYHSVRVDFMYESIGMGLGPFEMLHIPGHCAGHVAIRLHDVLFIGDHVLSDISPHQSPEQLTLSTGLEHYLHSLNTLNGWIDTINLTLPGHEEPILDIKTRIEEIQQIHKERLECVLGFLEKSCTMQEVSNALFGEVDGYNELLALEETGAHIEYLYQRGMLSIENLEELESCAKPIPIRYRSLLRKVND